MKIMLLAAGSRGDVEPFTAFARYAQARGHRVRLGLPENPGADTAGLDTASLEADFSRLIQDQGVSPLAALRSFNTRIRPGMRALLLAAVRHTRAFEPDIVLSHPKVLSAPLAAAALRIPHVLVQTVPSATPTRAFPAPGTLPFSLGPLNPATYALAAGAARVFRSELAEARALAGAVPAAVPPSSSLLPISPQLLQRPPDWPESVHLTGSWHASGAGGEVDDSLQDFMSAGPFTYAGFGSMKSGDAARLGRVVVEGLRSQGRRGLIVTGWGGIEVPAELLGPDILVLPAVPHEAVLPRAEAAVHHGGIGTLTAAVRSGTPSVIVPFLADQPFWGRQLHQLGLAPRPIHHRRLTARRLARALAQTGSYRAATERAGGKIRQEQGLDNALTVLAELVRP